MIQLTRGGTIVSTSAGDLERYRGEFDRAHAVRLPGLVEPALVTSIQATFDRAAFQDEAVEGLPARNLTLVDHPGASVFNLLLMNDRRLFDFVQAITGCPRIGSFAGRLYRMLPGLDHYPSWHDDLVDGRLVAITINLSERPYSGGVLQIRDRVSGAILNELDNAVPGDAILFRLSPRVQHRVTPVAGSATKTAFSGWFRDEPLPDLLTSIRVQSA